MVEEDILILDVDGTLSSLEYGSKNLTPLALRKLPEFIYSFQENEIETEVEEIRRGIAEETGRQPADVVLAEVTGKLLMQTEMGMKNTNLTKIHEKLWTQSLKNGNIKPHIYADVLNAFEKFQTSQKKLIIFSSNSVEYTKEFLKNSESGDLTSFIHRWYDQSLGSKKKSSTYEKILQELEEVSENCLYVSDNPLELGAAQNSGIRSLQMVRPGILPIDDYAQVESLAELS